MRGEKDQKKAALEKDSAANGDLGTKSRILGALLTVNSGPTVLPCHA